MPPLSLLDYIHRGVVYTLLGISGYSIFVGVSGHSARRAAMLERAKEVSSIYLVWLCMVADELCSDRLSRKRNKRMNWRLRSLHRKLFRRRRRTERMERILEEASGCLEPRVRVKTTQHPKFELGRANGCRRPIGTMYGSGHHHHHHGGQLHAVEEPLQCNNTNNLHNEHKHTPRLSVRYPDSTQTAVQMFALLCPRSRDANKLKSRAAQSVVAFLHLSTRNRQTREMNVER
uniref:Uncharacterized protein n=1 Tax=Mycena chlorophos TaxID=658473 RepID=A0ABQ0LM06_MYCCL|nr:predicted protein [Mycena chlorophos]